MNTSRHFGRLVTDENATVVDVGALLRRLILFDQTTIESLRLIEIDTLVSVFGLEGFLALLRSEAVRIISDTNMTGRVSQDPAYPPTLTNLVAFRSTDQMGYLAGQYREMRARGVASGVVSRLERDLTPLLMEYPDGSAEQALKDTELDVMNVHPVLAAAVRASALRTTGNDPELVAIVVDKNPDGVPAIKTDLSERLGVTIDQEHDIVGAAVLALSHLNQRVLLMRAMDAVTGFHQDEIGLLEERFRPFAVHAEGEQQEQRLERVVSIARMPTLDSPPSGTRISVDRLLRMREDPDVHAFRAWLAGIDRESDAEIETRFRSIRDKVATGTASTPGRVVRFLTTAGIGAVAPPIGTALSAADSFLVSKVLGKPGPTAFLGKHYPKLFRIGAERD